MNEALDYATLGVGIAILAFLWNLHRDVANLRERMARLEGADDLLTGVLIDREAGRTAGAAARAPPPPIRSCPGTTAYL